MTHVIKRPKCPQENTHAFYIHLWEFKAKALSKGLLVQGFFLIWFSPILAILRFKPSFIGNMLLSYFFASYIQNFLIHIVSNPEVMLSAQLIDQWFH